MAIARTAKGTAQAKTSGTTLTIPSFTVPAGHSLIVFAGYDNAEGSPVRVAHAGRDLRRKVERDDAVNGFHASAWVKSEYPREQTGECVLSWRGSIGKRVAFASSFDRVHLSREQSSALTPLVTSPGTGTTGALQTADACVVCGFVSEGPLGDLGFGESAEIEDAGVFETATIGQTDGTTGGLPTSNITILEAYRELTATNATRGRIVSFATLRNWIGLIVALELRKPKLRMGVTASDLVTVEDVVVAAGGNPDDVYFTFDEDTGEWHAYEVSTPPGTLRAVTDVYPNWEAR